MRHSNDGDDSSVGDDSYLNWGIMWLNPLWGAMKNKDITVRVGRAQLSARLQCQGNLLPHVHVDLIILNAVEVCRHNCIKKFPKVRL